MNIPHDGSHVALGEEPIHVGPTTFFGGERLQLIVVALHVALSVVFEQTARQSLPRAGSEATDGSSTFRPISCFIAEILLMISLPSSSFALSSGVADVWSSCKMFETVLITPVRMVGHLYDEYMREADLT